HRVGVERRRAGRRDVPLDELVPLLARDVSEQLGLHGRPVRHCENLHAAGTPSSSSSLRSSCAPAGACATPFVWLLLLKNAYASSASSDRRRSGGTHSRSSSSP